MSGAALVALVILCFAGGYILVSSVFKAFEKPPSPSPPPVSPPARPDYSARSMRDYYRGVLLVPEGASLEEIEAAYQAQRRNHADVPGAQKRLDEIEEAYEYLRRNAGRG